MVDPVKRSWRYGLREISEASGRSVYTVRRDRKKGLLVPGELGSVALYIIMRRGK